MLYRIQFWININNSVKQMCHSPEATAQILSCNDIYRHQLTSDSAISSLPAVTAARPWVYGSTRCKKEFESPEASMWMESVG